MSVIAGFSPTFHTTGNLPSALDEAMLIDLRRFLVFAGLRQPAGRQEWLRAESSFMASQDLSRATQVQAYFAVK